jgi:hypothetical protein
VVPGKKEVLPVAAGVVGGLLAAEVVDKTCDAVRNLVGRYIVAAEVLAGVAAVEVGMTELVEESHAVVGEEDMKQRELESLVVVEVGMSIELVAVMLKEEERNAVVVLVAPAGQNLEGLETVRGSSIHDSGNTHEGIGMTYWQIWGFFTLQI